jgi:hypothetical protein
VGSWSWSWRLVQPAVLGTAATNELTPDGPVGRCAVLALHDRASARRTLRCVRRCLRSSGRNIPRPGSGLTTRPVQLKSWQKTQRLSLSMATYLMSATVIIYD